MYGLMLATRFKWKMLLQYGYNNMINTQESYIKPTRIYLSKIWSTNNWLVKNSSKFE